MIYNDAFLVSLHIFELKLMIYLDQYLVFENIWQLCFYLNNQELKLTIFWNSTFFIAVLAKN